MKIVIHKGQTADRIEVERSDTDVVSTSVPHKGPIPHDVVHLIVERELEIGQGFWGLVACGHHPEEIGNLAKSLGHASASRAQLPDPSIIPILQAERTVECFEADLWGGGSDPQTFNAMLDAGCRQSLVPSIAIDERAMARIGRELKAFEERWAELPLGATCSFDWPAQQGIGSDA